MVGIFSRFSVRGSHRRTQSALDERDGLPAVSEAAAAGGSVVSGNSSAATHGIEIAVEFKPVERPVEPLDNDQPIQCPLPEPSILNDGRIWKERVSSGVQRKTADSPALPEQQTPAESENLVRKPPRPPSNRVILPSASAPEHSILKLLEECNTSEM
ncbi:uncharacterized protein LOC127255647 [Andrographis paniculata]|uniref:uncharacterized protein LOC127255647 n=1 Tax=Andrographis paniculata TaxID=175694 RepID=UPI0021E8CC7E|nr:uncharacterized protein LOC127255647 [Andrographis paniculata]